MARKRLGRRERALVKVADAKRLAHGETTVPATGFFRSQWHGMAKGAALVQKRGDKLFDGRRNPERQARDVAVYDPGYEPELGERKLRPMPLPKRKVKGKLVTVITSHKPSFSLVNSRRGNVVTQSGTVHHSVQCSDSVRALDRERRQVSLDKRDANVKQALRELRAVLAK